jgi:hypothetical protein
VGAAKTVGWLLLRGLKQANVLALSTWPEKRSSLNYTSFAGELSTLLLAGFTGFAVELLIFRWACMQCFIATVKANATTTRRKMSVHLIHSGIVRPPQV